MSNNADAAKLVKEARGMDFLVQDRGSRHIKVYDGPRLVTVISRTASDCRNARNVRAKLRKAVAEREGARSGNASK